MVRRISRKYLNLLVANIIMSIAMNVAVILGTGMITRLIDEFILNGQADFNKVLIPTFICMIIGTIAAYFKKYFAGLYSINVVRNLNEHAIEKLPKIRCSFFEKEGIGKIITKLISDVGELERYYESTLPDLINNLISIVLVLVYVGTQNMALMLTSLCLYPIVLVITYYFGKKLRVLANKRRGKIDVMVERVTDTIEGMEIVRSYNLYEWFVSYIHEAIGDILDNEYVRAWIMHFSQTVNRFLFWIPNMLCPCLAMFMVLKGEITVGAMTAYIVLVNKIMGGVKMMPHLLNEAREHCICIERVDEILCEEEDKHCGVMACGEKSASIDFRDVSFAYDSGGKSVLDRVSFKIPHNTTVAFVGESGCGKSTIFKLLCDFYENNNGDILLNGRNMERRNFIALVEQQPFLFEGTVYENIAMGSPDVLPTKVEEAAKLAGIHDFIMSLPQKYETIIGENGAGLSGGEKQRIAIARALLKDAPVLLMDEPTASVDVETEKIIKNTIANLQGKKTILIIAHRLGTIRDADCIMVVSEGKICEQGTHNELIEFNGIYKKLYEYERKEVV